MSDNDNDSSSIEEEKTRGLLMSCSYLFLFFTNLMPTKSKAGNRTFLSLIICAIIVVSTISLIILDHKAMAQTPRDKYNNKFYYI
jgi:uncharacterized membrane protein